jgi:hypothetical protein
MMERSLRRMALLCLMLAAVALSGCMYPDDLREGKRGAGTDELAAVQSAVRQYREAYGVLPIKTTDKDTPIYEKYVIDFQRLLNTPYLDRIPANAYEEGGPHIYVIVDPETDSTVRWFDLATAQQVNDVQREVDRYAALYGRLPAGEPFAPGYSLIDYKRLRMARVQVRSVYSGGYLGLIMNEEGKVGVNYGPDIVQFLANHGIEPEPGRDLREYLVERTPFVPVKSFPYVLRNGEVSLD